MSGAGFLTKQVGPLPMGVWLLVGAGGLGISLWQRRNAADAPINTVTQVPVPVGAIASQDGAPVVISPIIRIPKVDPPNVVVHVDPPKSTGGTTPPTSTPPATTPKPATPRVPSPKPARTYTVRSGDTLTAIGHRYGVSWTRIYAANRAKIDGIARARGKSGGGHWIFPGTVLVIP